MACSARSPNFRHSYTPRAQNSVSSSSTKLSGRRGDAKSSPRSHVAMAVWASLCIALLAAAGVLLSPVTAKLSAAVIPSKSSANGTDWCDALKPCNETKTTSAEIESSYGLGLLTKKTTASSSYQYSSTTPATAVDWRTALTNWTVRDQGSCGEFDLVSISKCIQYCFNLHVHA